jgi:hypothetical protein
MSHLSPERLAALFDESPSAAEQAHLASCPACSRERGAYEALAEMAQSRHSSIAQPLTSWDRLAPALVRDGVIDRGRGFGRRARISRAGLQAAAAVLLVAGGTIVGRMTAPKTDIPMAEPQTASRENPASVQFASLDEAQRAATTYQTLYQASMSYIASHDPASSALPTPQAIKTRLAALDQVTQITSAALEDAPYDSVINNLYLNAQGQREASVRMLNAVSTRLTTY